jgi:hypothetical protein
MDVQIRLYTNEVMIHTQIESIQVALKRPVSFVITLNQKEVKSNIEFAVDEKEISTLKHELGYNVQVFNGNRWLPHL